MLGLGLGSKAVLRLLSPCSLPLAGLPSSVGIGTAALGAGGAAGLGGIDALGDGEAIELAVGLTLLSVLKSSSTNSLDARFGAFGSSLVLVSDVAVVPGLSLEDGVVRSSKRFSPAILARLDGCMTAYPKAVHDSRNNSIELSPKGVNKLAAKLRSTAGSAVSSSKLSISFSLDSRYLLGAKALPDSFVPPFVVASGASPWLPPRDRGIESGCWVWPRASGGWFSASCCSVVAVCLPVRTDGDTHCSARRLCLLYVVSSASRLTSIHPRAACKAGLIGVDED